MKDILEQIIAAGCQAPSGENTQPWRFVVRQGDIFVYNIPDRDDSWYNIGQYGSYVAHGALLHNMAVAADALGCRARIDYSADQSEEDIIARVHVEQDGPAGGDIPRTLQERCTNRRLYARDTLPSAVQEAIESSCRDIPGVAVRVIQDKDMMKRLATAASAADRLLFSNETLHRFFFNTILWNERDNKEKSVGLYVKTLELTSQQESGFKKFSQWRVLKFLNYFGVASLLAKQNAKTYATGSAHIAFCINTLDPLSCVRAGEAVERMWLFCAEHGLAAQPISGLLFLRHGSAEAAPSGMTTDERLRIHNAYSDIQDAVYADGQQVIFILRIGRAAHPSARSTRLPPRIEWYD